MVLHDGNGRTGRIILFRECLKHDFLPVIIEDKNRMEYIGGFAEYRKEGKTESLVNLFLREKEVYKKQVLKFIEI